VRYQRRYFGSHLTSLKFDFPAARSVHTDGTSVTRIPARKALSVSSMPISKPPSLSMVKLSTTRR